MFYDNLDDDFENEFDFDYAAQFWGKYFDSLVECDDGDFIENPIQKMKLIRILAFFSKIAENGDTIYPVELKPSLMCGDIEAEFVTIDLKNENVSQFCEVIKGASSVSMYATTDGKINISCVVPGVYSMKCDKAGE